MKLGMRVGLGASHIVLGGNPALPPLKGHKMLLGMELGLGSGEFVLDGDPAPLSPKGGPKFSAHVYCGQTAGWMKLVLGMEVGLSPGDFVLDGDPVPSPKSGRSPQVYCFLPCSCEEVTR